MKLGSLFCLVLFLGSCVQQQRGIVIENSSIPTLSNRYYITEIGALNLSDKETTMVIDMNANRISGYSGCNNYNAKATLVDNRLSVDAVSSTKRYCALEAATETALYESLERVYSFELQGAKLRLVDSLNNTLIKAQRLN